MKSQEKNTGTINKDYRSSKVIGKKKFPDFAQAFLQKIHQTSIAIANQLQMQPFESQYSELQLTMHLDGDFFKIHYAGKKGVVSGRKMTFVYYYHQEPKGFTGGNLLLFDTHQDGTEYSLKYTKVEPTNNSILFFPSHCYHKVTPIKLLTDDFRNGRYTLNGWLHDKKPVRKH